MFFFFLYFLLILCLQKMYSSCFWRDLTHMHCFEFHLAIANANEKVRNLPLIFYVPFVIAADKRERALKGRCPPNAMTVKDKVFYCKFLFQDKKAFIRRIHARIASFAEDVRRFTRCETDLQWRPLGQQSARL